MWSNTLRALLAPYHGIRVENGVGVGMPDVECAICWIELKTKPKPPERNRGKLFRIDHFTPQQRAFAMRRWKTCQGSWVILECSGDWHLIRGDWAATQLGKVSYDEVVKNSTLVRPASRVCDFIAVLKSHRNQFV